MLLELLLPLGKVQLGSQQLSRDIGIHLAVIGELGPQLFNVSMDPNALRERVADDIKTHLGDEQGLSRDDRDRIAAEIADVREGPRVAVRQAEEAVRLAEATLAVTRSQGYPQVYGVADYGDQKRLLHRITLAGDVPVSIDGVRSTPRRGDASAFSAALACACVISYVL